MHNRRKANRPAASNAEHLAEYLKRFLGTELELIREQLGRLNGSGTATPELPGEPLDTDDWESFIGKWTSRAQAEGRVVVGCPNRQCCK